MRTSELAVVDRLCNDRNAVDDAPEQVVATLASEDHLSAVFSHAIRIRPEASRKAMQGARHAREFNVIQPEGDPLVSLLHVSAADAASSFHRAYEVPFIATFRFFVQAGNRPQQVGWQILRAQDAIGRQYQRG